MQNEPVRVVCMYVCVHVYVCMYDYHVRVGVCGERKEALKFPPHRTRTEKAASLGDGPSGYSASHSINHHHTYKTAETCPLRNIRCLRMLP